MGKKIISKDHIGKKYNRLTIVDDAGKDERGRALVKCRCDCGKEVIQCCSSIFREKIKSCGCGKREYKESFIESHKTHGMNKTRLYRIYAGMKTRCTNPNRSDYKHYGGRGIGLCDEWKDDFRAFYEWAINNGYSEDLTIERKDVNKGYSPENCLWIPFKEQANNRRKTVFITYNGEKKAMSLWAKELGISYWTLRSRKGYGWTDTEIIEGKEEV